MARSACYSAAAQPRGRTELRLLIEMRALRELADRGLCDEELAVMRQLACATMRLARCGDVSGYRQANMIFHLRLLELAGDPAAAEVARLLLAPRVGHRPGGGELGAPMAACARQHGEIVNLLADDMVSAAGDLLRHHVSQHGAMASAGERVAGQAPPAMNGDLRWPIA